MREKFARLAISMNFKTPLMSKFELIGEVQVVEYKYLSKACFKCGFVGHPEVFCPRKHTPVAEVEFVASEKLGDSDPMVDPFGPWIVASRKGMKTCVNRNQVVEGGGSRFEILTDL